MDPTTTLFTLSPLPDTSQIFNETITFKKPVPQAAGADGNNSYLPSETELSLGRRANASTENDANSARRIQILDPRISGNHLHLQLKQSKSASDATTTTTTDAKDASWILMATDLSSNGVFVNGKRLTKNQPTQLHHNDVISFTKSPDMAKELPCWKITDELYLAQLMNDQTQSFQVDEIPEDEEEELAATLPVEMDDDQEDEIPQEESDQQSNNTKRKRTEEHPDTSSPHDNDTADAPPKKKQRTSAQNEDLATKQSDESKVTAQAAPTPEETTTTDHTANDEQNPLPQQSKYDEETTRLMKLLGATSQDLADEAAEGTSSTAAQDSVTEDKFAEELTCGICTEIMYKPVSVLPCLHSFCAPCYSQWMDEKETCPHCRKNVDSVRKNHILSNLVDKYLDSHPEKKRSEEELQEMDEKNNLTDDKLREMEQNSNSGGTGAASNNNFGGFQHGFGFVPRPNPGVTVYYGPAYQRPSAQSTGMHIPPQPSPHVASTTTANNASNVIGPPASSVIGPPPTSTTSNASNVIGPPASSVIGPPSATNVIGPPASNTNSSTAPTSCSECTTPGNDGFQCSSNQEHVACKACEKAMPLREDLPDDRQQKCTFCDGYFCERYFGRCSGNVSCGKFRRLKEHHMGIIPYRAFNGNTIERRILTEYMSDNRISAKSVFKTICRRIANGTYSAQGKNGKDVDVNDYCCFNCATNIFKDLTYDYRKDIPDDEFSMAITDRTDCWYGKECRAAPRDTAHAERYNHICENTRG